MIVVVLLTGFFFGVWLGIARGGQSLSWSTCSKSKWVSDTGTKAPRDQPFKDSWKGLIQPSLLVEEKGSGSQDDTE